MHPYPVTPTDGYMVIGRHRIGEAIDVHSVVSHVGCSTNVAEYKDVEGASDEFQCW